MNINNVSWSKPSDRLDGYAFAHWKLLDYYCTTYICARDCIILGLCNETVLKQERRNGNHAAGNLPKIRPVSIPNTEFCFSSIHYLSSEGWAATIELMLINLSLHHTDKNALQRQSTPWGNNNATPDTDQFYKTRRIQSNIGQES